MDMEKFKEDLDEYFTFLLEEKIKIKPKVLVKKFVKAMKQDVSNMVTNYLDKDLIK